MCSFITTEIITTLSYLSVLSRNEPVVILEINYIVRIPICLYHFYMDIIISYTFNLSKRFTDLYNITMM